MNWVQLRTMLWLRWRLTWNQWRRGGQIGAVITILLLVVGIFMAVAGAIGGVLGGAFGLSRATPLATMVAWDALVGAFLFFWCAGLIAELQRSEIIDVARLMHLPVSLRDVFILNYIASHLSLSLAALLSTALGLAVGILIKRGPATLLLFPLVFAFFFMITAWTYCLRGWLAALMSNKRRRHAIIVAVTMAFVLLMQLPNLAMNVLGLRQRRSHSTAQEERAPSPIAKERLLAALDLSHRYVPLLWLPHGARGLAEGHAWRAIWCAAGMIAIGAWGVARAYRTTVRFYQGGNTKASETRKPEHRAAPTPATGAGRRILVERTLPVVPEEAGAVALADLRSFMRAPEVKMGLATNVLIFGIVGAGMLLQRGGAWLSTGRPFVSAGVVTVTFIGLTHVFFNRFGFDRAGFRAIVLSPAPRRWVLLGKSLSVLPIAMTMFAVYLALAAVIARLGVLDILAAILEAGMAFFLLSVLGNLISILAPYRIPAGSMRPAKTKGAAQLVTILVHMFLPLALLPVFIPVAVGRIINWLGWLPGTVATLLCALVMVALSAALYWLTLEPLGDLLQRREQRILEVVTQEVE